MAIGVKPPSERLDDRDVARNGRARPPNARARRAGVGGLSSPDRGQRRSAVTSRGVGIVRTTLVASRAPRGLGPVAFRRLAVAIATPPSLLAALWASARRDDGDDLVDRLVGSLDAPRRLVVPPFAVLSGPGASELGAWQVGSDGLPEAIAPVTHVWSGSEPAELDRALRGVLAADVDVCVWYAALEHRGDGSAIHHDPGPECRVTLRRAVAPVQLAIGSAYHDDPSGATEAPKATTWLEVTGKAAPEAAELMGSTLGARLRGALGTPWTGTDYG